MSLRSIGKVTKISIGKNKTIIKIENQRFEISSRLFSKINLHVGDDVNERLLLEIINKQDEEKFFNYALFLLNRKEYTKLEISSKLLKRGCKEEIIKNIIDALEKENLINEESYINDYVEFLKMQNISYNKIIKRLKDKLFDDKLIKLIEPNEDNEIVKASNILTRLSKKYNDCSNAERKKKIVRSLLYLGFSYEVVERVIFLIDDKTPDEECENLLNELKKAEKRYTGKVNSKEFDSKVIKYLLRKGYCYNDILFVKGESKK